jgi:hypothetical protein
MLHLSIRTTNTNNTMTFIIKTTILFLSIAATPCLGFSMKPTSFASVTPPISSKSTEDDAVNVPSQKQPFNNILILDHLNINHEKGRHDLLKAFYFDFLQCSVDPRKAENVIKGKKTLWANIGAQQFHLPEGKPKAQILNGSVTLCYPNVMDLVHNFEMDVELQKMLLKDDGSQFHLDIISNHELHVIDPWGNQFILESVDISDGSSGYKKDERGVQNGSPSLGSSLKDITVHVPSDTNLEGIGRFYKEIFDTPISISQSNDNNDSDSDGSVHNKQHQQSKCVVSMGPYQTLTFETLPCENDDIKLSASSHVDLRDEPENNAPDKPYYISNYGPHISIYIKDIRSTYNKAKSLGVTYVNPRFSRKAYNEEEVVDDCMFRCLDIVDPENVEEGVILRLEHEVRSVVKRNGDLYKSCPFDTIQDGCVV